MTRTVFSVAVISIATAVVYHFLRDDLGSFWALTWISILLIIPIALPFVVRGYRLVDDRIVILRLFHRNVIRYAIIKKASRAEDLQRGLTKATGFGGLFSFSGTYKNKSLGLFQSYVNDWDKAVLIETLYGKHVLSPDNPDAFIEEVNQRAEDARARQESASRLDL